MCGHLFATTNQPSFNANGCDKTTTITLAKCEYTFFTTCITFMRRIMRINGDEQDMRWRVNVWRQTKTSDNVFEKCDRIIFVEFKRKSILVLFARHLFLFGWHARLGRSLSLLLFLHTFQKGRIWRLWNSIAVVGEFSPHWICNCFMCVRACER